MDRLASLNPLAMPGLQCQPLLLGVMREYHGCVLPGVGAAGGIVAIPEDGQQLLVGDLRGIVVDLDGLTVIAQITVGGILLSAARVSDARANNAAKTPEPGVGAPESAHGEGGCFRLGLREGINGRHGHLWSR